MRKFYFTVITVLSVATGFSQSALGLHYSLSIPQGEMSEHIKPANSINLSYLYALKSTGKRLAFGTEFSLGNYAWLAKEQDLRFPNGTGTTTMVNYTSNIFSGALFTRLRLLSEAKINPYLNFKGGYSLFFSNISVEDPEDPSDCRVLESKTIISDHTFFYAYGGGLQIDLSNFNKKEKRGLYLFDISVNKIKGGTLDYINTKHLSTHVHTDPNNPAPSDGKSEPLNIRFLNVSTQTIHEHQVAEVYNSPLRMLDIKMGILVTLQ